MKAKIVSAVIITTAMVMFTAACGMNGDSGEKKTLFKPKEIETEISVLCVGDIMAHSTQYKAAYDSSTGEYSFDENYKYVKDYISQADLALCNVETVFAGGEPCGYPVFNAPDALATDIKEAGFDVAITSNNHMLDQGTAGVERNVQVLRDAGLATVGSRLTEEEPEYTIVNVKGIDVGIVAYTYETTGTSSTKTINAINVPSDIENRICSFNPENWETDIAKVENNVQAARDAGADVVVCYFHWGEEYRTEPLDYQINMANSMIADSGVDVIFASHPHIQERADVIWSEAHQKNVPVYYSMGNFISNQRAETLGKRATEDGMLAQVNLKITSTEDGEILGVEMTKATAIPTWVNKYSSGGRWVYEIIPLTAGYESNESLTVSGNKSRADQSLQDSMSTIGSQYTRDSEGKIVLFDAATYVPEDESAGSGETE